MLCRTSSQICGRWYLPTFLLRDGLFALMYRASFINLIRFWSSLPTMEKLSMVTGWPEMLIWLCMGEGDLRCSLNLSSKFLADSHINSWITVNPVTFESVYDPTSFKVWVFILRGHQEIFDGMTSFQMHFNAIFFTSSLVALTTQTHNIKYWICNILNSQGTI